MPGSLVIAIVRPLILVALLVGFGLSLGFSLVHDQNLGIGKLGGMGRDPGVRVLLTSRRQGADGTIVERAHERLTIDILRAACLVSPDQPDDPEYTREVEPGEQLVIKPDVDGLVFSSQTWRQEGRWPVSRLRLVPRVVTGDAPASVGHTDPNRCEDRSLGAVFALGGRRYRGSLDVLYQGPKQLTALNVLPIESYVEGVIAVEMKASYHLEALKAQAIASRSYAYATAWKAMSAQKPWDLTDFFDDQEYRGDGLGGNFIVQAVHETAGEILVTPRLRKPFVPKFCASSGGFSESIDAVEPGATDVTGKERISQLMVRQLDPFCGRAAEALGYTSSHWEQQVVLRPQDLKTRLQQWFKSRGDARQAGYITDVQVLERDAASLRVQKVAILYTPLQRVEMSGSEFRMLVGPQLMRSTRWLKVETRREEGDKKIFDWVITTCGWGHGVGMSQISAWAMAQDGYRHQFILQTFYPGAEIQPW
jgi:peptidoglycan hydrolase-like amidase